MPAAVGEDAGKSPSLPALTVYLIVRFICREFTSCKAVLASPRGAFRVSNRLALMLWNYWIWEGCWRVLATYDARDLKYLHVFLDLSDSFCLCPRHSALDHNLRLNCWDRNANTACT